MAIEIRDVLAEDVYDIRHKVLWPARHSDFVKVDGDDSGWHFGVYENEMLIAVISLFDDGDGSMRFRKFATLPKFQNLGYGSQLLTFAINFAKNEGFKRLWCDARTDAFGFYRRFGFVRFSEVFLKEDIEYYKIEKTL